MKIIFFGLGSIGQRHAKLLIKSGGHEIFALRTHQSDAPKPDFPVKELNSWEQVDAIKAQIAFITNPTSMHIPTAIECAKRGMSLFMEKPLGSSDEGLDELLAIVEKKQLVSYVAYCLRFHPVILHLKELLSKETCLHMQIEAASYLPTWRPDRDHKKSYSSNRNLGGGVIFDLSHEIDYVDFFLGPVKQINGQCSRSGNVTVDAEDCADMQIQCAGGYANVHLSFLSHLNTRKITIYFPDRTVIADLITNVIYTYQKNALVEQLDLPIERDQLFMRQLEFFLANIQNPHMMNNIKKSADLFRKICQFREKSYVS